MLTAYGVGRPRFRELSGAACGSESRTTGLTRGGDRGQPHEPR